ncbi:hypothetical protein [Candidatus Lokiarchaeum ossiferum]
MSFVTVFSGMQYVNQNLLNLTVKSSFETEPNDNLGDATSISKYTNDYGYLDNDDWWSIDLILNQNVSIIFYVEEEICLYDIHLYREDGTTEVGIREIGDFSAHIYIENIPATETYYILVEFLGGTEDYYHLYIDDYKDDEFESNSDYLNAKSIIFDTYYTDLYCLDDDYYKIELLENWNLTFYCLNSYEYANLQIEILDGDGVTILNSTPFLIDDIYQYSHIIELKSIPTTGTYYIHIFSSEGKSRYDMYPVVDGDQIDTPVLQSVSKRYNDNGDVIITWSSIEEASIYYIYRSQSEITSITGLLPIGFTDDWFKTQYIDKVPDGTYYYVIVAGNGLINSTISNCKNITIQQILLNRPNLYEIDPNPDLDGDITLVWDLITGEGEIEYIIFRNTSIIDSISNLSPIGTTSYNFYHDIVSVDDTYYYVVISTNSTVNSSISDCEQVEVTLSVPNPTTLSTISPNPDNDGDIYLTWQIMPEVSNYHIFRDTSIITDVSSSLPIATVDDDENVFIDIVPSEDEYYYVICAENINGNSSISNCEQVEVIYDIPSAPIVNEINPNPNYDGLISLFWNDQIDINYYHIFREISEIDDISGLTPLITIGGTINEYHDIVFENQTYYYAIVAENSYGNSTISENQSVNCIIYPMYEYTAYNNTGFQWIEPLNQKEITFEDGGEYLEILHFNFTLFNREVSSLYISLRGYIRAFESKINDSISSFPSTSENTSYVIAPYLSNVEISEDSKVFVNSQDSYIVISWMNFTLESSNMMIGDFQAIIWENGDICFNYRSINISNEEYIIGLNYGNKLYGNNFNEIEDMDENYSIFFKINKTIVNEKPILNSYEDIIIEFNNTDRILTWYVQDNSTLNQSYELFIDNSSVNNDIINNPDYWTNILPISLSLESLSIGLHNITIKVFDGLGEEINDTLMVNVINLAPTVFTPNNASYAFLSNFKISWIISDSYCPSGTFIIFENDIIILTGSWNEGQNSINISLSGIIEGENNYTLYLSDGAGGEQYNSVFITIQQNNIPQISDPMYDMISTNIISNITWSITDPEFDLDTKFTIYVNGTEYSTGSWESGDSIILNVDNWESGTYEVKIVIEDGYGKSNEKSIIITILENEDNSNNLTYFIIGGASGVIVLSSVVVLIILKKKKK